MKHSVIGKGIDSQDRIEDLQQSMEIIEQKLDTEILAKQNTIEGQEKEIQRLHGLVEEKNNVILEINSKLVDGIRNNEGSRQLINKLLNDIERLNQDIEWYKRTYEKRNIFGYLKEKVTKRRR